MSPSRRTTKSLTIVVSAAFLAMVVAACGGSKKPPAPSSRGASHNSGADAAYRFSACMRTHGVTNFQDPHVHTDGNQVSVMIHVGPAITGSPAYRSAQRACGNLLPGPLNSPSPAQQRVRTQDLLAFASCMRRHGFPKFPDPTVQGQLTLAMLRQAGIDLQQPAVRPAAYACAPLTHGILTRAAINQALANSTSTQTASGGG